MHITEIEEEGFREVHLCSKCAHKYLNEADESALGKGEISSAEALVSAAEGIVSNAQCPVCKLKFEEFRNTGRLGCPHDYEVFREELRPLLENIHGSTRHIGKLPRRLPADARMQTQIIQLRQELQQAVAVEDYERAARIRDQIEALEKAT